MQIASRSRRRAKGTHVPWEVYQEYRSLVMKETNMLERGRDVQEGGGILADSYCLSNRGDTAQGQDQWGSTEMEGAASTEMAT